MGRQASVIVRALGRSPLERPDPLEAEEFTARQSAIIRRPPDGYVQLYDERGHPYNPQIKASTRRFRKAQNDVLFVVGVVGKNEDQQQIKDATEENGNGVLLSGLGSVLSKLGGWWIEALRARYQTFESYSRLPLVYTIARDRAQEGVWGFYLAGLPYSLLASLLDNRHSRFLQGTVDIVRMYSPRFMRTREDQHLLRKAIQQAFKVGDYILFALSVPARLFSILQLLSILPAWSIIPFRAFVPFHRDSLYGLPDLPQSMTLSNIVLFGSSFLVSPFFLVWTYETANHHLYNCIFGCLRQLIPKPDKPDHVSLRAASEAELDSTDLPGLAQFDSTKTEEIIESMLSGLRARQERFGKWARQLGMHLRETMQVAGHATRYHDRPMETDVAVRSMQAPGPDSQHRQAHGSLGANFIPTSEAPDIPQHSLYGVGSQTLFETQGSIGGPSDREDPNSPDRPLRDLLTVMIPENGDGTTAGQRQTQNTGGSQSRVRFTSIDASPSSTPPTSPTLRASFVQRDSNAVTLQLQISVSPNERQPAEVLVGMYKSAHSTLWLMLRIRNRLVARAHDTISITQAINNADHLLRWVRLYEEAHLSQVHPDSLREIFSLFEEQRTQFVVVCENSLQPVIATSDRGGHADRESIIDEIYRETAEESTNVDAEIREIMGELYQLPRRMHATQTGTRATAATAAEATATAIAASSQAAAENTPPPISPTPIPIHPQPSHSTDTSNIPMNQPLNPQQDSEASVNYPWGTPLTVLQLHRRRPNPYHRVTALSNFPADSLASHISHLLTTALLLPLQSLLLRSVAHHYLHHHSPHPFSSPSTTTSPLLLLLLPLRPLTSWFGLTSTSSSTSRSWPQTALQIISYTSTTFLLLELQEFTDHVVWRLGTTWALGLGRTYHGWGQL